jgi:hypothetical protein
METTGKFTGTFLISSAKSTIYAQIPQFRFWNRELTGNFQICPKSLRSKGLIEEQWISAT